MATECPTHCWHMAVPVYSGDGQPPRQCCWCGCWQQEPRRGPSHGPYRPDLRWQEPQRQLAQALQTYAMQMAAQQYTRQEAACTS